MATKIIMTDGTRTETLFRKSINAMNDETPGVWSPETSDNVKAARSNRLVPSVFAGVNTRMQAMADLPFTIYSLNGDKTIDSSDNYKNNIGFLPDPYRVFALSEGALVTAGRAYWHKGIGERTKKVKKLKYWLPSSVTLDTDAAKTGEIIFKRQGTQEPFTAEQVLYMWLLDPDVELGPPIVWPLESAIISAEANGAISKWVADYMRRGAVKAMLLMVDGAPPPGEAERIEKWFNRFMTGARGLMWRVFNGEGVKPVIVGDGLEALKDLSINKELRYEIHQALGTRHLLEDENLATAVARERQFYTVTIVPDARLIQTSLNEQILHSLGYHIEFEPERLEIFQVNEGEQAKAFGELLGIFKEGMSFEAAFQLAAEKLDYQFTDEQLKLIKSGIAEKNKVPEVKPVEQPVSVVEKSDPLVTKRLVELDRWETKNEAAGKMVTWHARDLLPDMVKAIYNGSMTFEAARAEVSNWKSRPFKYMMTQEMQDDILPGTAEAVKALADSINRMVETPKEKRQDMNTIIIDTNGNTVKAHESGNAQILEAIKALVEQGAVKQEIIIPAPVVNFAPVIMPSEVQNNVQVQAAAQPINNITVKPADVVIPPAPTEATITTDKATGKKTLKVVK